MPQPATVYHGVQALPPGTLLVADETGTRLVRYWTPEFGPKLDLDYPSAQARVREALRDAVRVRLRSDVPVGVFLSGGIDSSIVAYEAAQQVGATRRTFTVASSDPDVDESPSRREPPPPTASPTRCCAWTSTRCAT